MVSINYGWLLLLFVPMLLRRQLVCLSYVAGLRGCDEVTDPSPALDHHTLARDAAAAPRYSYMS